ncbi:MAG: hypothetical protein FJ224_12320 [Lentisphaerae bacterium]|nr:hypothetical protein [Lentisphaerota bacterium]
MLKYRVISGCLLIAGLILGSFYLPAPGVGLVLVAVSYFAQREFYALAKKAGIPVFDRLGAIAGTVLITATFLAVGPAEADVARAYRWEVAVLSFSLIAVFVRQFPQKNNTMPLPTIGCTLLGVWYVPYLFNFFTRLLFSWDGARWSFSAFVSPTGRWLVLYMVAVVKAADTGAYFVGRMFGRRKLFPRISPAKTWEGLFGGIASAVAVSAAFHHFAGGRLGAIPFGLADALGLGAILALVGVIGDMFESLLKRAAQAKDSSDTVPGMGGILDVLDSLLFGAPVMFVFARWHFGS